MYQKALSPGRGPFIRSGHSKCSIRHDYHDVLCVLPTIRQWRLLYWYRNLDFVFSLISDRDSNMAAGSICLCMHASLLFLVLERRPLVTNPFVVSPNLGI